MQIQYAERIRTLPPYLFAAIDQMKREALLKGADLIDLSIGDPDIPTLSHIVDAMKKAVEKSEHHRYPSYEGMLSYRKAVADWYKERFNVELDPEKEVISLIGSKEGIGHIPLAFIDPGDIVLVPSPGYPVYPVGTKFAGGIPYFMPLKEDNGFLPDIDSIPEDVCKKAKLMFINYPNNPTSACAGTDFYKKIIEFANKYNIIVCHDAAYSEVYYEEKPISFMQIDGAKDVGIEFHSLSKTYNMTGWRIGFAVGNKDILAGLGKVKTNLDSGVFQAIQEASIVALKTEDTVLKQIRNVYRERRDILYEGLKNAGFALKKPAATFYLWVKVPNGKSIDFVAKLLKEAEVLCTPGVGFGEHGEGYIRFALTQSKEKIKEAVERIRRLKL
ncbi:LL-diaminopimelate aminotransferase [Thermodesulfovibrio yellowstonii]|uniref:Aminotransferase n=1 Tax=Thermodesulfovibrio yellowstonii (strain ATCC 51303 / DSM 11347 / YP87) TaxID=289376 RepID=B5YHG6_THEYD|nr:LL-diaminopimelate aminotransferase [Thermodesulfovibrio yellowstonii]ACI21861.1 aminotransferase [Thermodesulfovibrio yellowstonii DSM 11347]